MRLIDADALLLRAVPHGWSTPKWVSDIVIEDAPTIDAVPVVRCKDCKHRILNENYNKEKPGSLKAVCELDTGDYFELGRCAEDDDWFCADGERKDDEK